MDADTQAVINSAQRMMEFARQGQRDFELGGERRLSGLYAAVTSARSVTFTIQNLRNKVDGFDEWYELIQKRLREDAVCRWFVALRNSIEKEGDHGTASVAMNVSFIGQAPGVRDAPPGTKEIIIGDSLGRSYWVVELPDGTEQQVFFQPPSDMVNVEFRINDAPDGRPLDALLDHYLNEIQAVFDDARARFG